jgi:polyisoprenoid-binding protein YceI
METEPHQTGTAPRLGRYVIDTAKSSVNFKTRHVFGLGAVHGKIAISNGAVEVAEPLADSSIRAEIDAETFDSGSVKRDDAVRSSVYLHTDRFPVMAFAAERIEGESIHGSLTVCGVTRPVVLSAELSAATPHTFRVKAGTRIDRTEFGVTAGWGMTGRYLDVVLDVECVRA